MGKTRLSHGRCFIPGNLGRGRVGWRLVVGLWSNLQFRRRTIGFQQHEERGVEGHRQGAAA